MDSLTATVTSKGQIVIPADIRRRYGIHRGTKVSFIEEGGRLVLQPITPEFIDSVMGSLKGSGPSLITLLRRERKKDWPR